MAWVWAWLVAGVLLPLHIVFPAWNVAAFHLLALLLLILAGVCGLQTRGDEWVLPFLLGLCGFLAMASW